MEIALTIGNGTGCKPDDADQVLMESMRKKLKEVKNIQASKNQPLIQSVISVVNFSRTQNGSSMNTAISHDAGETHAMAIQTKE